MSTTISSTAVYANAYTPSRSEGVTAQSTQTTSSQSDSSSTMATRVAQRWAEIAAAEANTELDTTPRQIWATLQIGSTPVAIDTEGGVSYSGTELDIDIDWENLNAAEERAEAIMSKYGGTLTTSAVESGTESMTSELMSKMFSSDALVDRMLMTSSGESLQEGLLPSDEDANGAQASASATSATSTPQAQSTAA
ncbi:MULTISPECIES: hypothetical protein [Rhizobium/Agrobacterium group]|uniref:hypothetical protein n=1 Tax=Rhizobium/Agrobacterium group TaxID=227290 RepID=UPI0008DC1434|nr:MULTISPECIES: hypothetical protein [Rhizobium/Agrobacterium group]